MVHHLSISDVNSEFWAQERYSSCFCWENPLQKLPKALVISNQIEFIYCMNVK